MFVTETQEVVKAEPGFMLFATQNPPGQYGGRKVWQFSGIDTWVPLIDCSVLIAVSYYLKLFGIDLLKSILMKFPTRSWK